MGKVISPRAIEAAHCCFLAEEARFSCEKFQEEWCETDMNVVSTRVHRDMGDESCISMIAFLPPCHVHVIHLKLTMCEVLN